ncbi:hypothetical protein EST38_g1340 [Candolleomyces aberdarensis]|uniref:Uncharacterized protein n=1 Tax=Candolleomyces aberdarensis TaxID=2316362 RepID=A0A4Q2DYB2_9AGAR|nr:hypothetical protein EST38_g1340 [Candolleomyces aberdarensis]
MSNPLRRVLLSLKTPASKPWHLVVTPDPNLFAGYKRNSSEGEQEYILRLDSNFGLDRHCKENPTFGFAANDQTAKKLLSGKSVSTTTEWIRVIDTNRKSSDGLSVRDLLVDLLRQFPRFDLQSPQAAEEVVNKIESRLAEVASFKEVPGK